MEVEGTVGRLWGLNLQMAPAVNLKSLFESHRVCKEPRGTACPRAEGGAGESLQGLLSQHF